MLKLLASYLVILGHALENDVIEGYQFIDFQNPLCLYIYSFHMPLFMILAGYFSAPVLSGRTAVMKRFRQLIIPCIPLAAFPLIYGWHMPMWFLKSLFLCYAMTALCTRYLMRRHHRTTGAALIALFILLAPVITITPVISVGKPDFMLPFFILGAIVSRKKAHAFHRRTFIASGMASVICLCLWNADYIWYHSPANYFSVVRAVRDGNHTLDTYNLWCCTMRFITGASVSLFLMNALRRMEHLLHRNMICTRISTLGRYSMHIYILQTFFVEQNILCIHYPPCSPAIYTYLLIPAISLGMFILCILTSMLLERITIVNALLFGNRESQDRLIREV